MEYRNLKRVIDVILALVLLPISIIIIFISISLVLIYDFGNPFFYQYRIGYRGKQFKLWKIRSMYIDSNSMLLNYLRNSPSEDLIWKKKFKLDNDPRVLPTIGKVIRKTGIDELPQLINILTGEMSFVGPRPLPAYHIEQFHNDFIYLRNHFRPGLTGYWQINPKRKNPECSIQESDQFYMENFSIWLDIKIICRTFFYCIGTRNRH